MMDGVSCPNCGGWMYRVNSDDELMNCDTCPVVLQDGVWHKPVSPDSDELVRIPQEELDHMKAGGTYDYSGEDASTGKS